MLTRQLSHEGIDSIILELTTGVVDEGIIEGNFSYTQTIAEQEIENSGPITKWINGKEWTRHVLTSLEGSIGSEYSSSQDITRSQGKN